MKKLLLACLFAAGFSYQSGASITVAHNNPGECGYKDVQESHTGGIDALSCLNPGYCDCYFSEPLTQTPAQHGTGNTPPEVNAFLDEIEATIQRDMTSDVTSGSFPSNLGIVNWSSKGNTTLTYQID